MFSRVFATIALSLALISQVQAHATVSPVLGVQGAPVRKDAQRPKQKSPCGKTDIASNLEASGTVTPNADGTITMTVTNFNKRLDGSRQMTATLDATGTGNSFNTPVTITQNGESAPKQLGSEQLTVQMPAGVTCTGGASGNLCLMSFKSLSGFGNCVVVAQGGAAGGAATGAAGTGAATGASTGASTGAATGAAGTGATGEAATGGATGEAATGAATGEAATGAATGAAGTGAATGATGATGGASAANKAIAKASNIGGSRLARAVMYDLLD